MEIRRALVCAPLMPEFDREGGSRRVFDFLRFFQRAGWNVSFAADNAEGGERYAQMLQQMGIPSYAFHRAPAGNKEALIRPAELFKSGRFDVAVFAFWDCAEPYIPVLRGLSPSTKILIDSIDMHLLRESRRVFCGQPNGRPQMLDSVYADKVRRELNVYAAADAVITVSQKEAGLINDFIGRPAYSIPLMEDVIASTVPFEDRKGMLFVGNFRHPPNVHAVEYLCKDILPNIPPAILAEHPLYIVGNDPNEFVLSSCKNFKTVRLVGWVPSVLPYLQQVRVSLVPLLYGAGTKTKLMQSLMAGTPAVSTSIGIEGFELHHDQEVLVADTATTFASSVIRLLTDKQIWGRLAKTGWEFMQTRHGSDVVFERFSRVLAQILNPASIQPIFVEEMEPGGSSRFDYEFDTMVREKVLREGRVKGFCNVWGRSTEFVISSDNLRESIVSTVSSSINRHRQLICALSMAIFGHPQASLPALAEHINQSKWKVYIAEGNSVLSNFLMRNLNRNLFVCSEYFGPAYQSGEGVNGVLHEDLLHTSFPDEAFNLIITSEVLEHVSDAPTAERELARILKPGGIYCFTVPFAPAHEHDLVYAEVDEFGNTKYLSEPQFHEDPLRPGGALVYRVFTFHDLKQRFESLECEFTSYRFWSESVGILGSDCWAHTVKKRSVAAANMAQGAASP